MRSNARRHSPRATVRELLVAAVVLIGTVLVAPREALLDPAHLVWLKPARRGTSRR